MLSQENINKLHMNGIYECKPVIAWLPSYKQDTPYHCCNWTFRVKQYDDKYYMVDTYWSTGDGLEVKLTDENFEKFNFLFDLDEVDKITPPDFYDYDEEDRWHIALDSGGYTYSRHYFVRKGAKKNKEVLLERLNYELESLKRQVKLKEDEIKKVKESATYANSN